MRFTNVSWTASPTRTNACAILTKLAAIRGRNEAIPVLEQIARDYPDSSEAPKALYQIGQTLWNRHENAQAFEYFKQLLQRYPSSAYADRANFASGDIHEYFGRKSEAIELYTTVQKQFPNSSVRDDAVWRLAWLYYRSGDWQAALTTFKALAAQSRNGNFGTAALYWQARSAEKLGDTDSAKQIYRQIFNGGEESYYQTLSQRALERLGSPVQEANLSKPSASAEADPAIGAEVNFHLSRARELTALGFHGLAVAELDQVKPARQSQEPVAAPADARVLRQPSLRPKPQPRQSAADFTERAQLLSLSAGLLGTGATKGPGARSRSAFDPGTDPPRESVRRPRSIAGDGLGTHAIDPADGHPGRQTAWPAGADTGKIVRSRTQCNPRHPVFERSAAALLE